MTVRELVVSMSRIENRLQVFERRYGLKSPEFYQLAEDGRLEDLDGRDDFFDFLEWRGLYKLWLDCKQEYDEAIDIVPDLLMTLAPVPLFA